MSVGVGVVFLTFYRRGFEPAADALHVSVAVPDAGNRLGTAQLHQVPQVHGGDAEVPLLAGVRH